MKPFIPFAAAGILLAGGAFAQNAQHSEPATGTQSPTDTAPPSATQAPSSTQTTPPSAQSGEMSSTSANPHQRLRQELRDDLDKAGFTNVRVMPGSFLVKAKDRSGQPVAMIISPDSITEVVDEGSVGGTATGTEATNDRANSDNAQMESGGTESGGTFISVPVSDRLSSKIVGTSVYNDNHQDIGTIKDIAYGRSGVQAYIVGVGGFLGMGDHYVAVQPAALQLTFDHNANAWRATMNATADQLKSAPEYKYPGEG